MRIVAGMWRGRRIAAPPGRNVRPTLDRVREAWMSILQHSIPGARVLDLYAGSGALGLECLSRGAGSADFVEKSERTRRVLEENIELLGAGDAARVIRGDALAFARSLPELAYDIAMADPPYDTGDAGSLAEIWLKTPFSAVLGIEHESRIALPGGDDTRRYGSSAITFYRNGERT